MAAPSLANTLRRSLLIKVISKATPSREDLASVIELTASKVVEALEAQSMTLYVVEGNDIIFKHIFYSPTLWGHDKEKEKHFRETAEKLLTLRLPLGTGNVGKVIATGQPLFFSKDGEGAEALKDLQTGFEVHSMLTVPLKTSITLGAIQVLNKEPSANTEGLFVEKDLTLLTEVAEYSAALLHRMIDPKYQVGPEDTARFIAKLTGLKLITAQSEVRFDEELLKEVGDAVVRREGVLPCLRNEGGGILALMANPLDYSRREAFQQSTGLHIDEVQVAPAALIEQLTKKAFKLDPALSLSEGVDISSVAQEVSSNFEDLAATAEHGNSDLEHEDSAPVIQLANRIIEDAYLCGASDIHIEPQEKSLLVRYRVDGLCQEKLHLPQQVANALVTRLKIMCNLDIAERRLPQDGRIVFKKFTNKAIDIDLRVATGPMNFGEKVCMRILDKQKSTLPLTALGFSAENLERYLDCIRQPYGMILHCGPTGSGKSMTLYSALSEINTPDLNIQTAEDPIEYTLPGINQMQMNRQVGLTFARALRCYLRMDPDVILVGEIRDQETAEIAIEAALTGHLLVSTLHTNDAPSTIARITEMGVEPFNVSASLVAVCAQRLLRRVCKTCRQPYTPEGREKELLEKALQRTVPTIHRANKQGCPACGGTGYKGRIGIHELMTNSEELTSAINKGLETAEIKRIAMRGGMKTLHQDSMLKVEQGFTTLEEALANVPPDLIL